MSVAFTDAVREYAIPGGWAEKTVQCGALAWQILLPADADEFLNQLAVSEGEPEPDVYWAQVWPPALILGELILRSNPQRHRRVLELGCGIGLVGLAALAAGTQVTFSDYVPMAVELAVANARRNGFNAVDGLVLDWKAPVPAQFDWIVGSDILYDRHNHEALVEVLDRMLTRDGEIWIGDAGRFHVPEFIERAWQRGFDVELRDEAGQPIDRPTSGKFQLVQLRRVPS